MPELVSPRSTIPGIEHERVTPGYALLDTAIRENRLPSYFPLHIWNQQQERYIDYWAWFNGDRLNETQRQTDQNGDPMLVFPLQVNFVRTAAYKRAAVVIGEADDEIGPLIKTVAEPRLPLDGKGDAPEADHQLARLCTNLVNEVWTQAGGRVAQQENAVLGEFLGGSVFKLVWHPFGRDDLLIPVTIEKVMPDFFMPIWNPRNYQELYEVFEIYRITAAQAQAAYGVTPDNGQYALYVEHWKRDSYSITIDGKYVRARVGNLTITFKDRPNPWKRPPYVYNPSQRAGGSFFGGSFVEDVRGLVKEYNSRMADSGDAIRLTIQRRRYLINANKEPEEKQMSNGVWYTDIGSEPPLSKHAPEVFIEDPPNFTAAFTTFTDALWQQMLRVADLQNIAFGEDEGSQRSAMTLALRMWPTTAKAIQTRTFWTDGLNLMARMILRILAENPQKGYRIPSDFEKRLVFHQKWPPKVPRDREQEVNEVVALYPSLMTPETAIRRLSTVGEKNIPSEIDGIKQNLQFQAGLAQPANGANGGGPNQKPASQPQTPKSVSQE